MASTGEVDGRSSERNDENASTRDHNEDTRGEDGTGLPKVKTEPSSKTNDMDSSSSFQPFVDNAAKSVKEEHTESPSGAPTSGQRGDRHKPSILSCTSGTSKLPPMCSSPSRSAESSRTHLFSPQPPSGKVS